MTPFGLPLFGYSLSGEAVPHMNCRARPNFPPSETFLMLDDMPLFWRDGALEHCRDLYSRNQVIGGVSNALLRRSFRCAVVSGRLWEIGVLLGISRLPLPLALPQLILVQAFPSIFRVKNLCFPPRRPPDLSVMGTLRNDASEIIVVFPLSSPGASTRSIV